MTPLRTRSMSTGNRQLLPSSGVSVGISQRSTSTACRGHGTGRCPGAMHVVSGRTRRVGSAPPQCWTGWNGSGQHPAWAHAKALHSTVASPSSDGITAPSARSSSTSQRCWQTCRISLHQCIFIHIYSSYTHNIITIITMTTTTTITTTTTTTTTLLICLFLFKHYYI